jgi:endonuclease/exonuclease/phosphatase (EEP) superfamily protein YafD
MCGGRFLALQEGNGRPCELGALHQARRMLDLAASSQVPAHLVPLPSKPRPKRQKACKMPGRDRIRVVLLGGGLVFCCLVLLGFLGRHFPAGDAAAVIRPQAGVALAAWAALLWLRGSRRFALASMVIAVVAIGSVVPSFTSVETTCTDTCLTLYQKNLLSKAWPRYELADDIVRSGAEIVTLQEVSDHNLRFMAELFDRYTVAATCSFRPEQAVAVLTLLPVEEGSPFCVPGAGLAGVRLLLPDGLPIWVLSVHLEWPFPFDQSRQSQLIAQRIADLDGPVLIAGDFNMVPWGGSVERIREAAGNERLGSYWNTYRLGGVLAPLPIDTVLVPEGTTGSVELRPYMGSDHMGVLARFALP